jgi:MinD superfamily P-loop ATPase
MPDVSMCLSTSCPKRKRCYRNPQSGTVAGQRQSYFMTPPYTDEGCEYYISVCTIDTERLTNAKKV